MNRLVGRDLVMVMLVIVVAGGIALAPAQVAWARQDLRVAVARDPGDGVLGDPGDGFGGDPNAGSDGDPTDGLDGDPNDGVDAVAAGRRGALLRAADPGDGDGIAGDPGDGDGRFPRLLWRSTMMNVVLAIVRGVAR